MSAIAQLFEALKDPEREAEAWERLLGFLRRQTRLLLGDDLPQESSEVASSVAMAFYKGLESGRLNFSDPARLAAYLRQAVNHKVSDVFRSRRAQRRGGGVEHRPIGPDPEIEVDPPSPVASVSQLLASFEEEERIRGSLGREERLILALRAAGHTWPEIGAHLGKDAAAVRKRFHRLRERFRGQGAE